ncbi:MULTISPECIES: TRAP transporter large permease [Avibacterium]|uniref:TRAP transporter large permease protein n=1 Tax=Avibacterium paragallinarum TaxID=728 RepID=A0A0F5EQ06_AVIPA|nr:TRAP transporter large permease [Avibacterium paragallinarum]AZI13841.1 TRAP transporter large permease [Avibacterium paragallinarum]MEE3607988.1 TRAP transporter large permease [Avibacterium paragallinarum]MEE3620490.1 TRAP transporter large permease [Avibacterium paragallinarum]MEE3667962.1 TRAP transporter large permease [Avibacterium paragallinarum]MEE3679833.1 TRAP transporter large permease [Avibacterium paragallinarum]
MEWSTIIVLSTSFFILLFIGVPISFSIGIASLLTISLSLPFDSAIAVISQKMASGLDSFSLLAIPFFILAGNIMNRGGIALRLIEFAKVIGGRLPGALAHVNVLANMMFGSISGSAVASGAAMGGIMSPLQKKEGYDPAFSTAVNIASCPTGLLIPPSNTFIVYSLISGGTSIGALFLAGYIPGILMGLSIMLIVGFIAKKRHYPISPKPTLNEALKKTLDALPSLGLIIVIMGGIIGGIFTATEASAFAVVYTLILAMVVYREVKLKELPQIILDSVVTTAIVLLLIGTSMGMSWAMANADIPYTISDALLAVSENPIVILLIINLILLVVGVFMDMTPALLIFTPIFLPIVTELGMDPVHFGIVMAFNLSIGICTPPVGSALFIGCSVGGVKINQVIKPLLPFYFALIFTLLLVTYLPEISLFLPKLLLGY